FEGDWKKSGGLVQRTPREAREQVVWRKGGKRKSLRADPLNHVPRFRSAPAQTISEIHTAGFASYWPHSQCSDQRIFSEFFSAITRYSRLIVEFQRELELPRGIASDSVVYYSEQRARSAYIVVRRSPIR